MGLVPETVLTDIANAIRAQNGKDEGYLVSEMADAIRALDGTRQGEGGQRTAQGLGKGLVRDEDLRAIADAIRAHNGRQGGYRPGDMAQAIRDLTFAVEPKARALLLDDNTLEFTYLPGTHSPSGADVVQIYEVGEGPYSTATPAPWYGARSSVRKVVFDESFAETTSEVIDHWFSHFEVLETVEGMANIHGVRSMQYTFQYCKAMEQLDLRGFDPSHIESTRYCFFYCEALMKIVASPTWQMPEGVSGTGTFSNCTKLVGGAGTAYKLSAVNATYFRIDAPGTPGYLTAG